MFITSPSAAPERSAARWLRRVCGLVACLALVSAVQSATPEWRVPAAIEGRTQSWQMLGQGNLRWLGFRVYEAALWVPDNAGWHPQGVFALEIRYQRDIASARLVKASLEEMRRLEVADEADLQRWRSELEAAFPDVAEGDVIVGMREEGGSVAFYHRDALTVRIDEKGFADAFFAIWLDERTREPGLRERLMGNRDDG